jgi:NADH:ubiquinone reductase (H+-translocating)
MAALFGSLMGSVIGRSFQIEAYFARLMYQSLYKMHEAALLDRGRTLLGLVAPGARSRLQSSCIETASCN